MNSSKSDLQRLLQLVENMSKGASGSSNQELLSYYLHNVGGLNINVDDETEGDMNERALIAFKDLFEKLHLLQQEYAKLEKTKRASLPSPPSEIPQSIRKMLKLQNGVITIQAWWRKVLTFKRLQQDVKLSKAALTAKKNQSPEETAMKEFAQQLKAKKLTPEMFFRICDTEYKQTVTVANFKEMVSALNLHLSRAQMSRLIMILDEDIEGNITLEEFNNALEAYGVAGERHKPLDGNALYHPFEHRCLFKLISELTKKGITFIEMFNACDVNDDARVNLNEIRNFVEGLTPDFKQKEVHALMNYLDIDKNGIIDKDEFLRQLNRGEQTLRQTQMLNKQISDNRSIQRARNNFMESPQVPKQQSYNQAPKENDSFMRFEMEDVGGGDQAFLVEEEEPSPVQKFTGRNVNSQTKLGASTAAGSLKQPVASQNPEELKKKQIVEKMEREGLSFSSFFDSLKRQTANGLVPLGTVLKLLEESYKTLTAIERNTLVKDCIRDMKKVDYAKLEDLISKYSKNLLPTTTQTFQAIANNIFKKMGTTPAESLKQFFRAQNLSEQDLISEVEFGQIFARQVQGMSYQMLSQAFNSLNVDMDGFVPVKELMEVLQSYIMANSSKTNAQLGQTELKKIIPGIETMSPRTRCESVIDYAIKELTAKSMKPLNVYKMADATNQGSTSSANLEAAFKKLLPNIKQEVISEVMLVFKVSNPKDLIRREDFETVFIDSAKISQSSLNPKQTASTLSQQSVVAKKLAEEDEATKWIKKLDNAFLREGLSPSVAFKAADVNHNGVISIDELKATLKRLIPEDTLSLVDIKKIVMAFDTNRNGTIDEQEFIAQIEKARNTTITIIETPIKSRFAPDIVTEERRATLPTKDQIGAKTTQKEMPTSSIALAVNQMDEKINLKKVLGELPLNEEGRFVVAHISRRLKSEKTSNGSTLNPSEYFPIIKVLDPSGVGVIDAREMISFLDKHLTTNNREYMLELKYMANFLEFQMQNRNTKMFLENNSSLKQGNRLLEVEVMTALNKIFGVPMQIGNAIYKQLQSTKGGNFMLDDLCALIDQQRLVKVVDEKKPMTESQKLDPEKVLQLLKTRIQALPKRIQQEISTNLYEIDLVEKQIPFKDFFKEISEQNQLLNGNESKALYAHIKATNQNFNYSILTQLQILLPQQKPEPPKQEPQKPVAPQTLQQQSALDPKVIAKNIELSIKRPLEQLFEDLLRQDATTISEFNKRITSIGQQLDKQALMVLSKHLNKSTPGLIQIKDLILFLKEIPGKFNKPQIISELENEIDPPYQKTLEDFGLASSQYFNRNEFYDILCQVSSISTFKACCLFYDLSQGEEELLGENFLSQLSEVNNSSSTPVSSTKKGVSFSEPVKDPAMIKKLQQEFVNAYARTSLDQNVESALLKLSDALKQFKTFADSISKFDASGKGSIPIDWFRKKLDDIKQLTDDEKIALTFIPVDKAKSELSEVNLTTFFNQLRTIKVVDKVIAATNKQILQQVYNAISKTLSPVSVSVQEKPVPKKVVIQEEVKKAPSQPSPSQKQAPSTLKKMGTKNQKVLENIQNFIIIFKKHLADPQKREGLYNLFNSNENKEIQYSDLYEYIETVWKEDIIIEETEALNYEIDVEGAGGFRMNDFIRFCQKYELVFEFSFDRSNTLSRSTKKEIKGTLMKCGQLEYDFVPELDCYNGCSTILTSLEAALVVADKLYKEIPEGQHFFDKDFGPTSQDPEQHADDERSRLSLYFNGTPPPGGYPKPQNIQWLRPEEYTDEEVMFINEGASANDVKQGKIGDCWLISALSVLATRDELLTGGMVITPDFHATQEDALKFSKGLYSPVFHIYRKKKLYVFRFFKNFNWVYVIIDERIPCEYNKPCFGRCTNMNENWVCLIEKAYAKLHGCYEALISGFIDDAMTDLTGFVAEKIILQDKATNAFPHKNLGTKDEFWNYLVKRLKEKCLMGCSKTSNQGEMKDTRTGIIAGHAYGLMDAFELFDPEIPKPKRQTHRLIRIRNPHGNGEWLEKWSDNSPEMEKHYDKIKEYVENLEDQDEKFEPGENDGTFLMNYQSFRDLFNNMFICVDFPDVWSGIRYNAEWNATCSGGLFNPYNEQNFVRWAQNPQYLINNSRERYEDLEIFVSLAQPDGRGQYVNGAPIKFPYKEVIHPIMFTVMELPAGQQKITRFDPKLVKGTSVLKEHKEVSCRVKLGDGNFVIVVSTHEPGQYGPFTLSIYYNKPTGGLKFQRIDQPKLNNYDIIREESENARFVKEWMVDLCNRRVKTMIQEQDFSISEDVSLGKSMNSQSINVKSMKLSQLMQKSMAKNTNSGTKKSQETEEMFPDDEDQIQ